MVIGRNAFGKLERWGESIVAWHPLVEHMSDVARCFECLYECDSIRRALESAANRKLDKKDVQRLAVIVFFHDLGKASTGFQSKRWLNQSRPLKWPVPSGHGLPAVWLFQERFAYLAASLPIDAMDSWGDATWSLLLNS